MESENNFTSTHKKPRCQIQKLRSGVRHKMYSMNYKEFIVNLRTVEHTLTNLYVKKSRTLTQVPGLHHVQRAVWKPGRSLHTQSSTLR